MEVIGIIAEYNPFHNGHLYHINEIKKRYPDSILIAVISTYFCQRGEPSVISKWEKTKIALENGIDLVIELPFAYATQSADLFSYAACKLLNSLGVKKIVFGSESNNITSIMEIAKAQVNNDLDIKKYLKEGLNYPTALAKAIEENTNCNIKSPNDLLGISYVKEILRNNYDIEPVTIKRTNDYNSEVVGKGTIASAKAIRNLINNHSSIDKYVPGKIKPYDVNYFYLLKYKIIASFNNLNIYQTVDNEIEVRIKKYILNANSLEELIKLVKTKKYTYNRINRALIHILTSFTKEEFKNVDIDYIRILGMNKTGQVYLKSIKKTTTLPIITRYKDIDSNLLKLEYRSVLVYSLIVKDNSLIKRELEKPIILK